MNESTAKVYGDQAYRLQTMLANRIGDIYSRARTFHLTHAQVLVLMCEEVWKPAERLGAAEHSYLMGYAKARADEVYRRDLVWLMSCDGRLMTRAEIDALTAEEVLAGLASSPGDRSPWQRVEPDRGVHVWADATGNPLRDKPY